MTGQIIAEPLKEENAELGKIKPAKRQGQAATPMIDKIIGRCKADRRAIEMLDEDQKDICEGMQKRF
jgi:hypothetical protein